MIAATGALTERSRLPDLGVPPQRPRGLNGTWWLVAVGLALFIGLRHEVGGDWLNYLENFQAIDWNDVWENAQRSGILLIRDPGYRLFEWLANQTGSEMYGVNFLCAALFAYGLVRFCRSLPNPWLALTAAIPYMVTVVAMGYTRQAVAMGCAMAGFTWLIKKRRLRFCAWVFLGSLFHQTAFVLLPLAMLVTTKRWFAALIASGAIGFISVWLLFQREIDRLANGYIAAAYDSEGALIRLMMNAFPAALFLLKRKAFTMTTIEKRLWTWLSIASLGLLILWAVSPSSTAVDRAGLYVMPLQLAIFAHLPNGYQHFASPTVLKRLSIGYFASTLVVWLNFATHSVYWLPYRTLIIHVLSL